MNQLARNTPRTLAYVPLDSEHILACARVSVLTVMAQIAAANKLKWFESLKAKAKFDCCRRPENLDIEAWYSKKLEADKGEPDVYKFYCRVCEAEHQQDPLRGYCHAFFCVGGNHPAAKNYSVTERPDLYEIRPYWEVR